MAETILSTERRTSVAGSAAAGSLPGPVLAPAKIRVETISDYQAFLDLEPVWNEVAEAAGLDHPFLEHAWVRTWWECFGGGSTLQILVLKAGDQTMAIAPLILTRIRMWGIKVRRLGFFYNAHVPRADFLIAQRPEEVYRAIWGHLHRSRGWDLLQLCQLPEGSATLDAISAMAGLDDCQIVTWLSGASPYLPLGEPWSQYFDRLTSKHRANLRNRLKRLSAIGPVEVETVTSGERLANALEAGLKLEAAAWKGEAHTAISCNPHVSRFYSMLAERTAERGWLRLNFLQAGRESRRLRLFSLLQEPGPPAEVRVRSGLRSLLSIQPTHLFGPAERVRARGEGVRFSGRQCRLEVRVDQGLQAPLLAVRLFEHLQRASSSFRQVLARPISEARQPPAIAQFCSPAGRSRAGRGELMYVSSWPGLTVRELFRTRSDRSMPYPLSSDNRLSFCVARSGIYHLFRALRFKKGDVVLVPDYHSGNEVSAIRAAGATIVYYPILRNLEPDLDALSRLAKLNPRVIYVIHYLGWPQPMKEIAALCRERGSILIEDCALSLLSETDQAARQFRRLFGLLPVQDAAGAERRSAGAEPQRLGRTGGPGAGALPPHRGRRP